MGITLLLLWLTTWLNTLPQWRLVYMDGTVQAGVGSVPIRDRLGDQGPPLRAAWMWSGWQAPRRVEPSRLRSGPPRQAGPYLDAARLDLRVVLPKDGAAAKLAWIAAPVPMWADVPEDLLPRWPVPATGRLSIPVLPAEPWRVRLSAPGMGSWWVDLPAGRQSVAVTPVAAPGIDLTVVGPDGRPAAELRGTVLAPLIPGRRAATWVTLRGDKGRVALPGLPDHEEVTLILTASGATPAVVRGRPSDLRRELRLTAGCLVRGRLLGRRRAPVAGVEVTIEGWAAQRMLVNRHTRSAPDGTWRLDSLPPGRMVVSTRTPGYAQTTETVELAPGSNDLGDRVLVAGRQLGILVVDDEDMPLAGADVLVVPGGKATSDRQGKAILSGVPEPPLEVTAHAAHHLDAKVRIGSALEEWQRVELRRSLVLQGRLVNEAGTPLTTGIARIVQGSCSVDQSLGGDGRFEADATPGKPSELALRSPGFRELRLQVPAGAPGEVRDLGDLTMPSGRTVTGRVIALSGGDAIAGARVWLPRPGPDGPVLAWVTHDLLEASTNADGQFRLSGLEPGSAVLRVEADGFARAHVVVPSAGGEDKGEVSVGDVGLTAGGSVRLLTSASQGVNGATDSDGASAPVARIDLRGGWLEPDMLTAPVVNGEANFDHIPAGKVTASVMAARKLICEHEVEVPEGGSVDVDCRKRTLVVSGVVLVGGRPAGPGTLVWEPPALAAPGRIDNTVSPGGLRQQQAAGVGRPQVDVEVNADGTFVTEDLAPGHWQVLWNPQSGSLSGSQAVDLPESERFETTLSFPGIALMGVVMDERGEPVAAARVQEMVSGALAIAGADGAFTLAGVKPGKVALRARMGELSSVLTELVLAADRQPDPVRLVVKKQPPPGILIQILSAEGAPVPGAVVFLDDPGGGQRLLTTDAQGSASASLEPPLPERVRAAAFTPGGWTLGGWVSLETAREGIALQVGEVGSLAVTSELRGELQIVSQDGWNLSSLLRQLGASLAVQPRAPLRVDGLPAGAYGLSLSDAAARVTIAAGKLIEVRLPI